MPQRYVEPGRSEPGSSAADIAACRSLLRGGSRTFHAASLTLPQRIREPATALYAFCRLADDAVDLADGDAPVALLRERLDRVYRGKPLPIAADRAFADVVRRFGIPRTLPEAMLEGFEWDASGRRYRTLADLQAYAARVAGTVGAMMTLLMGVRSANVLARACDLGVAMQLTNIARDVGEDARAGRLYLPLDWLDDAGIDADAWLAHPVYSPAIGSVVQRLLTAADVLYDRASQGVAWLPLACRPGMHAARILYAEIGREVERRGMDSVSQRAHVSSWRKTRLLAKAIFEATARRRDLAPAMLEEVRFLVDSAADASGRYQRQDRVEWLLNLFERLQREQPGQSGQRPG